MSEKEKPLEIDGIAAILGFIVYNSPNNEVRITKEQFERGLPEQSQLRVTYDVQSDETVIEIVAV